MYLYDIRGYDVDYSPANAIILHPRVESLTQFTSDVLYCVGDILHLNLPDHRASYAITEREFVVDDANIHHVILGVSELTDTTLTVNPEVFASREPGGVRKYVYVEDEICMDKTKITVPNLLTSLEENASKGDAEC